MIFFVLNIENIMTFPIADEIITTDPYTDIILKFKIADETNFGQYKIDKASILDMLHIYGQTIKAKTSLVCMRKGTENYRVNVADADAIVERLQFSEDHSEVTLFLSILTTTQGRILKGGVSEHQIVKCEMAGRVNEDLSTHDLQLLNIKID
jgi:hypothetical protein